MSNEYLQEYERAVRAGQLSLGASFWSRRELCRRYSFAIPNDAALDAITGLGPIVELGAGTGYWARLLAARSADIIAFDKAPGDAENSHGNYYSFERSWFPVQVGLASEAGRHPGRALLLVWPCYATSFAHDCLDEYQRAGGDVVAYLGEWRGCTGNEQFHDQLDDDWELRQSVDVPQWDGLHDELRIFRRAR